MGRAVALLPLRLNTRYGNPLTAGMTVGSGTIASPVSHLQPRGAVSARARESGPPRAALCVPDSALHHVHLLGDAQLPQPVVSEAEQPAHARGEGRRPTSSASRQPHLPLDETAMVKAPPQVTCVTRSWPMATTRFGSQWSFVSPKPSCP